ncbi:MAG: hypothetical protein ACJ735_12825 [Actinomycetes bacterium]
MSNHLVRRRLGRFAIVAFIVSALLSVGSGSAHAVTEGSLPAKRVVVVAVPGLSWSDVSATTTPGLWAFAGGAARGLLTVKSANVVATCADALTTLGAGNRAVGTPALDRECPRTGHPDPSAWPTLRRVNRGQRFGAQPGALADALAAHGLAARPAVGAGAWLAAARSDGSVASGPPAVLVVEFGQLYDAADAVRANVLADIDRDIAAVFATTGPDDIKVVVGAGDERGGPPGLRVAMIAGPGFTSGRLHSDTTGRSPYVELIDVAPTALSLLDVSAPSSMVGQPWRMSTHATSLASDVRSFVDRSNHARKRVYWGGRLVRFMVGAAVMLCIAGALLLLAGFRQRATRRVVELLCYAVAALPVSAYLLQLFPWWRWSTTTAVVVFGIIDVVVVAIAGVAATRRPPWGGLATVAAGTAAVLGLDLMTGTHLQLDGLLGDATTIAGRFHGAGNTDFAIFATTALLTAGVVAVRQKGRRNVVAVAGTIGVVALVLDGAPSLGDDLGGVLALAPALVVLIALVAGARIGPRIWVGALAVGVAAGLALIGYDLVAGGGHIGRFAGQAGRSGARVTIDRKLAANLGSWHRSDYVASVGFGLIAVAVMMRGPLQRALNERRALAAALVAVAVCAVLGGVLNDSGVVVPGAAAVVAVPLMLAGCLRAQR